MRTKTREFIGRVMIYNMCYRNNVSRRKIGTGLTPLRQFRKGSFGTARRVETHRCHNGSIVIKFSTGRTTYSTSQVILYEFPGCSFWMKDQTDQAIPSRMKKYFWKKVPVQ